MNRSKVWLPIVVLLSGAVGACSGDDSDGSDGAGASGASAGAAARSGSGSGGNAGASGNGSGNAGSTADPNQPAAPGVPPTFIPNFPGAGTSGDDAPLTNGELCDYVPLNGAPTPAEITTCFFSGTDPNPAATMEQVLECVDGADLVHIRLTFSPTFADNTYGANAIGWSREDREMNAAPDPMMMPRKGRGPNGHSFMDLVGSDHAEIQLTNEEGEVTVQFKLDYISEDASEPSGYGSLGVTGGEGEMIIGDAAWVVDHQTSIETNLNERGYGSYTVDSPATDDNFSVNPDAPEWDFRVVYEAWIDVAAFGDSGFGTALIEFVHASPSKASSNTLEVEPGECPPVPCEEGNCEPDPCDSSEPDAECDPGNPPDDDDPPSDGVCDPTMVDVDCADAGPPPDTEDPMYCLDNPTDPLCHVD